MHLSVVTDLESHGVVEGRSVTEEEALEVSLFRLSIGDLSLGFSEDFREWTLDLGAMENDSRNALV